MFTTILIQKYESVLLPIDIFFKAIKFYAYEFVCFGILYARPITCIDLVHACTPDCDITSQTCDLVFLKCDIKL